MTDPFFIALSDVVADNKVTYGKLFGERQQSSIDTDNNLLTTLYNATKNHLKYMKNKTEGVDYCLPSLEDVTQHIRQHQCISNVVATANNASATSKIVPAASATKKHVEDVKPAAKSMVKRINVAR